MKSGFTLVEMSIALIIIGLVAGGILTGQDLMNAAATRAQISQIQKYNTAVRTFQNKYGYLPGDIIDPYASSFGFQPRGTFQGEGDGNGILEGNCWNSGGHTSYAFHNGCGELAVFWQDLSTAGLIDTSVPGGGNSPSTTGPINGSCCVSMSSNPGLLTKWLPVSKLGVGNFVYEYGVSGVNYFAVSSIANIGWSITSTATPGLTVQQAYTIDSKIDDGLPQSGNVTACYVNYTVVNYAAVYAAGNNLQGANGSNSGTYKNDCVPSNAATPYASTNCFDNNGNAGTQQYSLAQNANIQNCALSFKFQ